MDGKGPSHLTGRGKLSRAGLSDQFGPSHSAFTGRAERSLVALPTFGDLLIYAKDLFVAASSEVLPTGPSREWLLLDVLSS